MPHLSDGIVMLLRSSIMIPEQDLTGPSPPRACSSLDDGPNCERLSSALLRPPLSAPSSGAGADLFSRDDFADSAQYVVDGVLSNRLQALNKDAFDWSTSTLRTFSGHVSKVVGDSLSSMNREIASKGKLPPPARTGSKCFRVAFDRVPFGVDYLPEAFSTGLPASIGLQWEGLWQVEAVARRGRADRPTSDAAVRWPAARTVLRTAVGYLRFELPVVLRRFVISAPAVDPEDGVEPWGRGGVICGRLKGKEQWCTHLDRLAADARLAAPGAAPEEALQADAGDGTRSIDEVAIVAAPLGGLAVSLVEVSTTLPDHPLHSIVPQKRRVVLLRPGSWPRPAQLEPVLATVSRDAAVWDVNEVLRHHMLLRPLSAGARGASPAAKSSGSAAKEAARRELRSFRAMLQDLKASRMLLPPGVTYSRLKREVSALVASTKEIADDDLLLHQRIESLLRDRMREKGLDGLLSLQAAWRRAGHGLASAAASEMAAPSGGAAVARELAADQTVEEAGSQLRSGSAADGAGDRRFADELEDEEAEEQDEEEEEPGAGGESPQDALAASVSKVMKEALRRLAEGSKAGAGAGEVVLEGGEGEGIEVQIELSEVFSDALREQLAQLQAQQGDEAGDGQAQMQVRFLNLDEVEGGAEIMEALVDAQNGQPGQLGRVGVVDLRQAQQLGLLDLQQAAAAGAAVDPQELREALQAALAQQDGSLEVAEGGGGASSAEEEDDVDLLTGL